MPDNEQLTQEGNRTTINLERIAAALERIANSLSEQLDSDGNRVANFYEYMRELALDFDSDDSEFKEPEPKVEYKDGPTYNPSERADDTRPIQPAQ